MKDDDVMKDGQILHCQEHGTVEAFIPKWWRLDRWLLWLVTLRHKGTVTIARFEGDPQTGRRLRYDTIRILRL
jgi:hypothetical protein